MNNNMIDIEINSERWLDLEDLPNEEWRDIKDFEGLYQVSNYGRVKSLGRTTTYTRIRKNDFIRGYCKIILCKNNKHFDKRIHILVAESFLDKNDFKSMDYEDRNLVIVDNLEVNHKDENKSNNKVNNLEFCTPKYNMNYGNVAKKIGKKLSKKVYQYDSNNNLICEYESLSDAHRKTGYGLWYLSNCCNGKCKKAYGYFWKFKKQESEVVEE